MCIFSRIFSIIFQSFINYNAYFWKIILNFRDLPNSKQFRSVLENRPPNIWRTPSIEKSSLITVKELVTERIEAIQNASKSADGNKKWKTTWKEIAQSISSENPGKVFTQLNKELIKDLQFS